MILHSLLRFIGFVPSYRKQRYHRTGLSAENDSTNIENRFVSICLNTLQLAFLFKKWLYFRIRCTVRCLKTEEAFGLIIKRKGKKKGLEAVDQKRDRDVLIRIAEWKWVIGFNSSWRDEIIKIMKIREKFYQTSPLKASRTSCYGRLVMNKAVRESTPRHRAMPAGKLVTVQSSECASVLTSPSWADCSAADRAGLVSWMISAGLRWINQRIFLVCLYLACQFIA